MKRILIIEDDPSFQKAVVELLAPHFQMIQASSGQEGVRKAFAEKPDLIVIDVGLPDVDGFEICRQLREKVATRATPIVMLTGETNTDSKVKGFDLGADDYISKPIEGKELIARIKARLRRHDDEKKVQKEIRVANLVYEPKSSLVKINEQPVHLTRAETRLLQYFLEHPNELISRERLLGDLWPDAVVASRTVDTHVAHLRKKLKDFQCELKTVFRGGYIMEIAPGSAPGKSPRESTA